MYTYYGPQRERNLRKLAEFDLLITTYGTVTSELSPNKQSDVPASPFKEIVFFRIVLDEGIIAISISTLHRL